MHHPPLPLSRDLVLIGGGHTHALLLRKWGMHPLPGARLTVINPGPTAPYSGMLPGHLAGHYTRDALDIDLVRLARFADARIVLGAVDGIDLDARRISVPGRPPIGFDVASIDIGVSSAMPDLPGFAEHAVPAKPLGPFATAWRGYLAGDGPGRVAVIGGGVAGAEIALALNHAFTARGRTAEVHLVERGTALSGLREAAAGKLCRALERAGVTLHEGAEITRVTRDGLELTGGRIAADFVCGAAGARPQGWLAETGLALERGYVTVDPHLQSSAPGIFAAGDCAHMRHAPRPKAGVFAVRQAPVLYDNLRAALSGTGRMRRYRPQKDYLKLISLGRKSALGDRFGIALSGPLIWRWKDRIDQKFMDRFRDLPAMAPPALPARHAAGLREALGPKPLCGGCGAKLGQAALSCALNGPGDVLPGDDSAQIMLDGRPMLMSTDHLREMVKDPYEMARIAAHHALGDIFAMGGTPKAATATVILPRAAPELGGRMLEEIMAGARAVFAEAGAEIVGGHSSQGSETTIGFTVLGESPRAPITLQGARPGDLLVLTKPLGSGVIMAAEMAGQAPGDVVAAAIRLMVQSQARASALLRDARAMTDVTGFGLLGHLRNICLASGTGARINLARVPLMPGARDLAAAGIRSSLYPENRAALLGLPETPEADLLFDPQTAGGLLAAVPPDADRLEEFQAAGYEAAVIGEVSDEAGQISVA